MPQKHVSASQHFVIRVKFASVNYFFWFDYNIKVGRHEGTPRKPGTKSLVANYLFSLTNLFSGTKFGSQWLAHPSNFDCCAFVCIVRWKDPVTEWITQSHSADYSAVYLQRVPLCKHFEGFCPWDKSSSRFQAGMSFQYRYFAVGGRWLLIWAGLY